jgi:hypothetical protein
LTRWVGTYEICISKGRSVEVLVMINVPSDDCQE